MSVQPTDDVIHTPDTVIHPNPGQIALSPAHMAYRNQVMIEGLLPAPRSAVTLHGQGPSLTQRAIEGTLEGALRYKSVLVAPMIAGLVEAAGAGIHLAPHSGLVGGSLLAISALTGGVTTLAGIAHIANPPAPHPVGTHHAGHAGKILVTAFGTFLNTAALGLTSWLGALSGAGITGLVLSSLGIGAMIGFGVHESGPRQQILDTDRIRAAAELAEATAQNVQSPFPFAPQDAFASHPIVQQVVWAMAENGLHGAVADGMPTVLDAHRWTLAVTHPGINAKRVIARLDDLAGTLGCVNGGLKIARGQNENQTVWSMNNVPLAALEAPGAHPVIDAGRDEVSIWNPISIGLDDDNTGIEIVIAGTPGMLIAGNPRMGKSNLESAIVCTIVRARDCRLWTIDASQRELPIYDEVADRHVGADIDEAIAILTELVAEIEGRGNVLKNARSTELTRQIAHDEGIDCIGLVIDELHHFTKHPDTKKATAFSGLLGKVVALGGATGVFTIVATQKPQADVIPSFIRDLIDIKFALRCETLNQVNTILGEGAHKSCPAHELKRTDKGVGYLKGMPDRDACRVRTHLIDVEERYAIVDQYAADFVPMPPSGPGGGGDDEAEDDTPEARRSRFYSVPTYPDGKPVGDSYVALWNAIDGEFTYREVAALGIYKQRGSVQGPLDMWRKLGYIVEVGKRQGPAGPPSMVYRKATAQEFEAALVEEAS